MPKTTFTYSKGRCHPITELHVEGFRRDTCPFQGRPEVAA